MAIFVAGTLNEGINLYSARVKNLFLYTIVRLAGLPVKLQKIPLSTLIEVFFVVDVWRIRLVFFVFVDAVALSYCCYSCIYSLLSLLFGFFCCDKYIICK